MTTSAVATAAPAPAPALAAASAATPAGQYYLNRTRILDNVDVEPGAAAAVDVAGVGGIPATGLDSIAVNIAAKGATASGSVIVHSSGEAEPGTIGVHYQTTYYADNLTTVKVGADGRIQVVNQGADKAKITLDVEGYTLTAPGTGLSYVAIPQARILPATSIGGFGNFEIAPLGKGGIPTSGVRAVALRLISRSASSGTLRVYAAGDPLTVDATIDYPANTTLQNAAFVKVGTGGKINIFNLGGTAEIAVDVLGYFTSATTTAGRATLQTVSPTRITEKLVIPANGDKTIDPRGQAGIPVYNVTSVGLNVSATPTTDDSPGGTIQVYPAGAANPGGQTVGYSAGKDAAGFTMAGLGADGKITLHNTGSTPAVTEVDVYSYTELVDRTFPVASSPGQAIENVTGTADINTATTSDDTNISISSRTDDTGTTTVKIPRDASAGITVSSDTGSMTIGLPASGAGTKTNNGTVVYNGSAPNNSIGIQPTAEGGFRTFAHLADASAPTTYDFPLTLPAGTALAIDDWDGGAILVQQGAVQEGEVVMDGVTRIQKPFAKDAQGRSWPTHYMVAGNTLRLVVDLTPVNADGTTVTPAFPVVADPAVKRNCGIITCSWYFSKATTRWIYGQLDTVGWNALRAGRIICGQIPHAIAKAACVIAIAYFYLTAFYHTRAAYNRGGCLVVKVNVFWGATPYTAWRTVRFDNVPLSNRYCYAS